MPVRSPSGSFRLVLGVLAVMLGLTVPRSSPAQTWTRTARLAVPIQLNGPMEALLDTLVHTLERNEGAVQRRPNAPERMSVPEMRNALIDEYGIGFVTANILFVDYRFEVGSSGQLEREIMGLHFLLRLGSAQEDIPLLYVNAQQEWVQKVLSNKGTPLPANEAAVIPFRRHLGFAPLAGLPDTQLVEVDGETVREGFAVKKAALLQTIQYLAYEF